MTDKELFKAVYRLKRLAKSKGATLSVGAEIYQLHCRCQDLSTDTLKRIYGCAAVALIVRDSEDPLIEKSHWRKLVHFEPGLPF